MKEETRFLQPLVPMWELKLGLSTCRRLRLSHMDTDRQTDEGEAERCVLPEWLSRSVVFSLKVCSKFRHYAFFAIDFTLSGLKLPRLLMSWVYLTFRKVKVIKRLLCLRNSPGWTGTNQIQEHLQAHGVKHRHDQCWYKLHANIAANYQLVTIAHITGADDHEGTI